MDTCPKCGKSIVKGACTCANVVESVESPSMSLSLLGALVVITVGFIDIAEATNMFVRAYTGMFSGIVGTEVYTSAFMAVAIWMVIAICVSIAVKFIVPPIKLYHIEWKYVFISGAITAVVRLVLLYTTPFRIQPFMLTIIVFCALLFCMKFISKKDLLFSIFVSIVSATLSAFLSTILIQLIVIDLFFVQLGVFLPFIVQQVLGSAMPMASIFIVVVWVNFIRYRKQGHIDSVNALNELRAAGLLTENGEFRRKCDTCGFSYIYTLADIAESNSHATMGVISAVASVIGAVNEAKTGKYSASDINADDADESFSQVVNYDLCLSCHSADTRLLTDEEWETELIARLAPRVDTPFVSTASSISTADELGKYKQLLDNGAITQEEYDAKKKQLLSL